MMADEQGWAQFTAEREQSLELEATLTAAQGRIAALEEELQDVRDRLDATRKSLLQRDKALDVQRERIAALEAENARLKAEIAVVEAKQCAWCKWWEPVLFHKDTGEADYGNCAAWEDVESSMLTERTGFCHRWQPEEAADAESV